MVNQFHPSVAFHIKTSYLLDWLLYEMQQWAEMG